MALLSMKMGQATFLDVELMTFSENRCVDCSDDRLEKQHHVVHAFVQSEDVSLEYHEQRVICRQRLSLGSGCARVRDIIRKMVSDER